MKRLILLDAGPLGLVTNPKMSLESQECYMWLQNLIGKGNQIVLPEIADYEVRRELIRAKKVTGLRRLDALKISSLIQYEPLTTPTLLKAADLWAQVRQQGKTTADPKALDGDVILAAQAILLVEAGHSAVIATTNVGHLELFTEARHWRDIS